MTPSAGNPSLPQVKTLVLQHPFRGVYRKNYLLQPEGNIHVLHRCSLRDGLIQPLPGYEDTQLSMTRVAWAGSEEVRGVINEPIGSLFYAFTQHRLYKYNFVGAYESQFTLTQQGTRPGGGGADNIDVLGGYTLYEGLARKTKLLIDGSWYTVKDVPDNTHITTEESGGTFTNKDIVAYTDNLAGTTQHWYGPRYDYFGSTVVLCGLYALYTTGLPALGGGSGTLAGLRALTRTYRGLDVVTFAGRPVLIGAEEATNEYDATPIPGNSSDILRWPTRSNFTDWASYGSGFLALFGSSALRAGCTWGEDAYIFTGRDIYQLIETGISAANPIALQKHSAKLFHAPISNVVQGKNGLYYWSLQGPTVFDGKQVRPLNEALELDLDTRNSNLINQGVHVWVDGYTRTIRFCNHNLASVSLQYIYWEEIDQWTTLDEDTFFLAGTGEYSGELHGLRNIAITTNTDVSAPQNEETGVLDPSGASYYGWVIWRGITMEEGPMLNKTINQIRVTFDSYNSGNLVVGMAPDYVSQVTMDTYYQTLAITGAENLQTFVFHPLFQNENAIWRLDIRMPPRCRIYKIEIDYNVAGDVNISAVNP